MSAPLPPIAVVRVARTAAVVRVGGGDQSPMPPLVWARLQASGLPVEYLEDELTRIGTHRIAILECPLVFGVHELAAYVVALLRNRTGLRPMVLDPRPTDVDLRVLLARSCSLRAPVLLPGEPDALDPSLLLEPLLVHGLACVSGEDVEELLRPPAVGIAYRWKTASPISRQHEAALRRAFGDCHGRGVFASYRCSEHTTIAKVNQAIEEISRCLPSDIDLQFGAPLVGIDDDEVMVLVVFGEDR